MIIWDTLDRAVRLHADRIGVVDGDRVFAYAQLGDRVRRLAGFLADRGVKPGDRIAILDHNAVEYLEAYYAAAGLGAILTPLNVRLTPKDLGFILRDSGARWLLTHDRFAPVVNAMLADETPLEGLVWIGEAAKSTPDFSGWSIGYEEALMQANPGFSPVTVPDDAVAHLYYTSGTTGRPKGVPLTHRNVCIHALAAVAEFHLNDADVWGHIAPMFHLVDAWAAFAITWVGGRHVMLPRFEAGAVLETMARHRVTISNLIPTMLNLMIKHPDVSDHDLSALRVILSGGSSMAPELVREVVETFGCDYIQTYGMTETSPYLTVSTLKSHLRNLDADARLAIMAKTGRPFLPVQLEVVDEAGQPVAPDEKQVGEIRVRGDTITPGYWNRPEETREAFRDGWLMTGDLAVVDNEGYVTIVDRRKDVIVTGGENVYSIEVENALYQHPDVLEAAAFGIPDPTWGEAVHAAVVPRPGREITKASITTFLRQHLAGYKVPKDLDFLDALPRTGSGKIYKQALRDQARQAMVPASPAAAPPE